MIFRWLRLPRNWRSNLIMVDLICFVILRRCPIILTADDGGGGGAGRPAVALRCVGAVFFGEADALGVMGAADRRCHPVSDCGARLNKWACAGLANACHAAPRRVPFCFFFLCGAGARIRCAELIDFSFFYKDYSLRLKNYSLDHSRHIINPDNNFIISNYYCFKKYL
jgi:hypothetical protein